MKPECLNKSDNSYKQIYVPRLHLYTTATVPEDDYIALSPEWERMKRECMKRDGFRCQSCGASFNLQIHHIRYPKAWGTELLEDLITLCDDCHKKIHNKGE